MLLRYWQYTGTPVTLLAVHRQCCYGTGSTPALLLRYWQYTDCFSTVLTVYRQSVLKAAFLRTTFKAQWKLYVPCAATLMLLTLIHTVYFFLTILTTDANCCLMQHSTVSLCSGDGCCWLHAHTELFLSALDEVRG